MQPSSHAFAAQSVPDSAEKEIFVMYTVFQIFREHASQDFSLQKGSYIMCSMMQYLREKSRGLSFSELDRLIDKFSKLFNEEICGNVYLTGRALRYIDDHYSEISLAKLAKQLKVNPSYLSSVISSNSGSTFSDIVLYRRLLAFVEFSLKNPALTVEQISRQIGYKSVHYFSRSFKNFVGVSPARAGKCINFIAASVKNYS